MFPNVRELIRQYCNSRQEMEHPQPTTPTTITFDDSSTEEDDDCIYLSSDLMSPVKEEEEDDSYRLQVQLQQHIQNANLARIDALSQLPPRKRKLNARELTFPQDIGLPGCSNTDMEIDLTTPPPKPKEDPVEGDDKDCAEIWYKKRGKTIRQKLPLLDDHPETSVYTVPWPKLCTTGANHAEHTQSKGRLRKSNSPFVKKQYVYAYEKHMPGGICPLQWLPMEIMDMIVAYLAFCPLSCSDIGTVSSYDTEGYKTMSQSMRDSFLHNDKKIPKTPGRYGLQCYINNYGPAELHIFQKSCRPIVIYGLLSFYAACLVNSELRTHVVRKASLLAPLYWLNGMATPRLRKNALQNDNWYISKDLRALRAQLNLNINDVLAKMDALVTCGGKKENTTCLYPSRHVWYHRSLLWDLSAQHQEQLANYVAEWLASGQNCIMGCAAMLPLLQTSPFINNSETRQCSQQHTIPKQWGMPFPMCIDCFVIHGGHTTYLHRMLGHFFNIHHLERFFYFLPTFTSTSADVTSQDVKEWRWRMDHVQQVIADLRKDFPYIWYTDTDNSFDYQLNFRGRGPIKHVEKGTFAGEKYITHLPTRWKPQVDANSYPLYREFLATKKRLRIRTGKLDPETRRPLTPGLPGSRFLDVAEMRKVYPFWVHHMLYYDSFN